MTTLIFIGALRHAPPLALEKGFAFGNVVDQGDQRIRVGEHRPSFRHMAVYAFESVQPPLKVALPQMHRQPELYP